jgi:hypothetical protein
MIESEMKRSKQENSGSQACTHPKATPMDASPYPSNHDGLISFMINPTHPVRPPIIKQKRDNTLEMRLSLIMTDHPFCLKRIMTFFPASK